MEVQRSSRIAAALEEMAQMERTGLHVVVEEPVEAAVEAEGRPETPRSAHR